VFTLVMRTLEANGIDVAALEGVLDFGCGSGRVLRNWKDLEGIGLAGVDYNPYLVEWSSRSLPFATFRRNVAGEPIAFEDASFDLAYSYSVFTHLDVASQEFWMRELTRILRPGGYLLLTVHGTAYLDGLASEDRALFDAGEVLVKEGAYSGSSACYVFHPRRYVQDVLAPDLELVDFVPGGPEEPGSMQLMQDAILLRKPGG
jgi:SAM-dependent methyltransferase